MKRAVPLPSTDLPGLDPLVNGALWDRWHEDGRVFALADRGRAFRYIRLKPTTSCRLTLFSDAETDAAPPRGFRVELYAAPERARVAFAKERGGFLDEEALAVVTPFPNDPKIPGLRHCFRSYRLRAALQTVLEGRFPAEQWRIRRRNLQTGLLAYKPGRRAVLRIDLELARRDQDVSIRTTVVLKLTESDRAETLHHKLDALDALVPDIAEVRRPRLLGVVPDRSVIASEFVEGTPLRAMRHDGWPGHLRRAGRLMARLHSVERDDRVGITPAGERRSIEALAGDYAQLQPRLARRLTELVDPLRNVDDDRRVLIHGDLHVSQLLARPDGSVLVDWDQAGWGAPLRDLGSLAAHLEVIGAGQLGQAFLDGYTRECGVAPRADEMRAWTARMLFLRLGDPFRRLEPDWPERMEAILGRIEALLGREVAAS